MARVLDEAIERAAADLVADEQSRAAVRGVLREWPYRVDPRTDPVTPDGLSDTSQVLTSGVAAFCTAPDPRPDQMSVPSWYAWWRADAWAGSRRCWRTSY